MAIQKLLALPVLKGAIGTIDAMICQTGMAQNIIDHGCAYVLNVKKNQRTLRNGIEQVFTVFLDDKPSDPPVRMCHEEWKVHGMQESRWCCVGEAPKTLPGRERWPGLNAIGMVISNTTRDGKDYADIRYHILSKKLSA